MFSRGGGGNDLESSVVKKKKKMKFCGTAIKHH